MLRTSRLYVTAPVGGPAGQPSYRNAVIRWRPPPEAATPARTLAALHAIEARHGRTRRVRNEARTLDLDLLAWGDRIVREPRLALPHPRALERSFVLAPWAEIGPDHRDPLTGTTVAEAWARLRAAGAEEPRPDPEAAWPPEARVR